MTIGRRYHGNMDVIFAKQQLEQAARNLGASAFGTCETRDLRERFHPEIRETAQTLPAAISIGVALQKAIMETIIDHPTEIYKMHYRTINNLLDNITLRLAMTIASWGYRAVPIPASKLMESEPFIGHVNHREVAFQAGLGWRGRNNLLVNPVYGSHLRLATVLTDLPLPADEILARDCGGCLACLEICPAQAIGRIPEAFDLAKCNVQVSQFARQRNLGQRICGLCIRCCPGAAGNLI